MSARNAINNVKAIVIIIVKLQNNCELVMKAAKLGEGKVARIIFIMRQNIMAGVGTSINGSVS